ncbi:SAM-dependent methyltransferase [Pedobacter roseus]|uniref:SAM-dependent methyltransferase n=1 Tax=Pedobacter roseus TaxID=336820 RepID=UPI0021D0D467|nr:SAM-dependent methyltransferase [Pedobacter roseus]
MQPNGRAAIVLPDSCLSSEAAKKIWAFYLDPTKKSSTQCNLHTILKLPDGVFAAYANGVKACVIFLQKGTKTDSVWLYDMRKNIKKFTTKSNPLRIEHFSDFQQSFGSDPNGKNQRIETERFKPHPIEEIVARKYDISFVEMSQPKTYQMPNEIIDKMIADYKMKIIALESLKDNLTSR